MGESRRIRGGWLLLGIALFVAAAGLLIVLGKDR
jgi:hypothetical protein